jgi:hypothetical protein
MNVTKAAGEAFLPELERMDPVRYRIRNTARAAGAASLAQRQSERQKEQAVGQESTGMVPRNSEPIDGGVGIGGNVTKTLACVGHSKRVMAATEGLLLPP